MLFLIETAFCAVINHRLCPITAIILRKAHLVIFLVLPCVSYFLWEILFCDKESTFLIILFCEPECYSIQPWKCPFQQLRSILLFKSNISSIDVLFQRPAVSHISAIINTKNVYPMHLLCHQWNNSLSQSSTTVFFIISTYYKKEKIM